MTVLRIAGGGWDAECRPDDGGGMSALRFGGRDILAPAPADAPLGGPFGAFWMIPWANRLDGGRLGPHRLPVNREEENTAIHGLSRDRPWRVEAQAPGRATIVQEVDAAPFRYAARIAMEAGEDGFALDLAVTNAGAAPLPFGAGWHPWFVRPPGTRLDFRAATRFTRDARGLPILAARATTGIAGDEAAYLGLDTHFAFWDGVARIDWPGLALTITATGALSTNLQVYAPQDQAVLCVEPSSHVPNAVNQPYLAAGGPMKVLGPGEILTGRIFLVAESSHMPKGGA